MVTALSVHAGPAIDGRDRRRPERLCRYIARPPLAQERLELAPDGRRLIYRFKRAWRDGTHAVVLEPTQLPLSAVDADDLGLETSKPPSRHPWAWLLARVFAVDVMTCAKCQGQMALKKIAKTVEDIALVLAQGDLGPRPPHDLVRRSPDNWSSTSRPDRRDPPWPRWHRHARNTRFRSSCA